MMKSHQRFAARAAHGFGFIVISFWLGGCAQPADDEVDVYDSTTASIVGGVEAQNGAWPGTVALYSGSWQVCGGALVADRWVMTAAHCVDSSPANGGISKVVIGRHALNVTTVGQSITVDKAYRHPGFSMSTMDNDIALLHLTAPASTAPKVKLVAATQVSSVVTGASVTVVGWGNTSESGGSSKVLREVSVPVVSNSQCDAWYASQGGVTDNQICAGLTQGGKDSCQGDSGGPLFMTIGGAKTQIGIVSWGIGCARPKAPGVYTRVSNYLAWLSEKSNGDIVTTTTPPPPTPPNNEDDN